jgi:DNA-binding transcriptional regulator YhcF (GntR family)
VEEKLSHALLRRYNELGSTIPFSGTKMASMLGVGRASLYRALELLENEKLITKTQKSIEIIAPEGLERKFK